MTCRRQQARDAGRKERGNSVDACNQGHRFTPETAFWRIYNRKDGTVVAYQICRLCRMGQKEIPAKCGLGHPLNPGGNLWVGEHKGYRIWHCRECQANKHRRNRDRELTRALILPGSLPVSAIIRRRGSASRSGSRKYPELYLRRWAQEIEEEIPAGWDVLVRLAERWTVDRTEVKRRIVAM